MGQVLSKAYLLSSLSSYRSNLTFTGSRKLNAKWTLDPAIIFVQLDELTLQIVFEMLAFLKRQISRRFIEQRPSSFILRIFPQASFALSKVKLLYHGDSMDHPNDFDVLAALSSPSVLRCYWHSIR